MAVTSMNLSAGRSSEYYGRGISIHAFDKRKVVLGPLDPSANSAEFARVLPRSVTLFAMGDPPAL
jgi:hypothetical protein